MVLIRCAGCQRNFNSPGYGQQSCPLCHAEVFVPPPEGTQAGEITPPPDSLHTKDQPAKAVPESESEPESKSEPGPDPDPQDNSFSPTGLVTNIRLVIGSPTAFFSQLRTDQLWPPLRFAWILSSFGILCSAAWNLYFLDQHPNMLAGQKLDPEQIRNILVLTMWTAPITGLLRPLILAGLAHLGIRLLTREPRPFAVSLHAICWGMAPLAFSIIPLAGDFMGQLWSVVLQVIGMAALHRIGPLGAAAAVLLPFFVTLVLLSLAVAS